MSDKLQHNTLVAFAALTALLAKHPELAEAPVSWSHSTTVGIHISWNGLVDDLATFEGLAVALGGSVHPGNVTEHGGETFRPHYLEAVLAGIPVFGAVHLRVEQDGDAK
jgi:hypothetical protein